MAINLEELREIQDANAFETESAALSRNLRKAAWILSFGRAPESDYRLHDGAVDELPPNVDAAAWQEDGFVVFRNKNQTVRRRSRMVERLVRLSAQTRG